MSMDPTAAMFRVLAGDPAAAVALLVWLAGGGFAPANFSARQAADACEQVLADVLDLLAEVGG
jgi:hypothetical protein